MGNSWRFRFTVKSPEAGTRFAILCFSNGESRNSHEGHKQVSRGLMNSADPMPRNISREMGFRLSYVCKELKSNHLIQVVSGLRTQLAPQNCIVRLLFIYVSHLCPAFPSHNWAPKAGNNSNIKL